MSAGQVAGGLAAAHWGYPAALGIGSGATAAGLIIFTATLLRPARPAAGARRAVSG